MLVLSRRDGEQIVVGGDIVITVVRCAGSLVRLGITAPQEVSIQRQELVERLTAKKQPTPASVRTGAASRPECS